MPTLKIVTNSKGGITTYRIQMHTSVYNCIRKKKKKERWSKRGATKMVQLSLANKPQLHHHNDVTGLLSMATMQGHGESALTGCSRQHLSTALCLRREFSEKCITSSTREL